jgi:hypothetical protein
MTAQRQREAGLPPDGRMTVMAVLDIMVRKL